MWKTLILVYSIQICIVGSLAQTFELPSKCGQSVGCFALPFGCMIDCHTVTEYLYYPVSRTVEFTMRTSKGWAGFAFNVLPQMPGLRGVMCINNDGDVKLSSRNTSIRILPSAPTAPRSDPVPGNTVIFTRSMDSIITCQFSRTLDVPSGSEDFMYDLNTNRYAVYAAGAVVNNLPDYHSFDSKNRMASNNVVDIRKFQVSPCDSFPCQNGGNCSINATNSNGYQCSCLNGFTGDLCQNSPCSPNPCRNNGICFIDINEASGFTCQCVGSFLGETCQETPCSDHLCQNGATCINDDSNIRGYKCFCFNGFSGENCQNSPCSPNPCENGGTCFIDFSSRNGFLCLCLNGFSGDSCKKSPCSPNPCKNSGTCSIDVVQDTGYTCSCIGGFLGDECEVSPTTTTTTTSTTSTVTTTPSITTTLTTTESPTTTTAPSPPPTTITTPTTTIATTTTRSTATLPITIATTTTQSTTATTTIPTTTTPPAPPTTVATTAILQTTTTITTTTTTSTTPPETTAPHTIPAIVNIKDFCKDREFGYYRYPGNSRKFIVCFNNNGWEFFCYQGLHWRVLHRPSKGYCGRSA